MTVKSTLHSFAVVSVGVEPGDRVVLTNLDVLSDGSLLKVVDQRDVRSELTRDPIPVFEVVDEHEVADVPPSATAAQRD